MSNILSRGSRYGLDLLSKFHTALCYLPASFARYRTMSQVEETPDTDDEPVPGLRRFHTFEPTRGAVGSVLRDRDTYLKKSLLEKAEEARWRISEICTINDLATWPEYAEDLELFDGSNKRAKGPIKEELNRKIALWQGDITKLNVDAIVNAANNSLLGGGGVDGAIHRTAGSKLLSECRTLNGCATGDAKISAGYLLPCKYVIHTVGPICNRYGGTVDEETRDLLKSCYQTCFGKVLKHNAANKERKHAEEEGDVDAATELKKEDGDSSASSSKSFKNLEPPIRSIAFPCISTGVYGYPQEAAAHVALKTTREWLDQHPDELENVIFCVFLDSDLKIYEQLLPVYFPLPGGPQSRSSGDET